MILLLSLDGMGWDGMGGRGLNNNAYKTNLSEIETPSLTSLAAAATTSGVKRFRVPKRSFFPSLSKIPQAHP